MYFKYLPTIIVTKFKLAVEFYYYLLTLTYVTGV